MLILSRRTQESVVVGGSIGFERLLKVTVLEIRGGQVRLGFEIDAAVPVHRWEVWERICASAQPESPAALLIPGFLPPQPTLPSENGNHGPHC